MKVDDTLLVGNMILGFFIELEILLYFLEESKTRPDKGALE
jgi:hypothetical protein